MSVDEPTSHGDDELHYDEVFITDVRDVSSVPLRDLVSVVSDLRDVPPRGNQPRETAPLALNEFIVKVYERCNLACDYCYMYEMADQTWKGRPVKMSTETFEVLSRRIADHAHEHGLREVYVIFHGGEPLLRGRDFFAYAAQRLRQDMPDINVVLRMQTNATVLNEEMLDVLCQHDVHVGVSLDGDRKANDRHRIRRAGASSFDEVISGIDLLNKPKYQHMFRNLYCTIDLANDPLVTYEFLQSLGAPLLDFLLPHGNWETRPPGLPLGVKGTPFADWLIPIFDRWYSTPNQQLGVRIFNDIIALLLGGESESEHVGPHPIRFACVDTDGSIELVDTLKSAFENAANTNLDVFSNSFNEVIHHPGIRARQTGIDGLSDTCKSCSIVGVCGGGNYTHRYRPDTGFANPSVYCQDLMALIQHIQARVALDIQALQDGQYQSTGRR